MKTVIFLYVFFSHKSYVSETRYQMPDRQTCIATIRESKVVMPTMNVDDPVVMFCANEQQVNWDGKWRKREEKQ